MINLKIENEAIEAFKLLKSSTCQQPLVSVVVPIYNVEKYLKECLTSLCNQTLQNIEIICINDGSKDASLSIALEKADLDSRITVITKNNSGPSNTRNCGLEIAKGEYVYFCDSDDYLDREALEACYTKAKQEKLDVVMFSVEPFTEDKEQAELLQQYHSYYNRSCEYAGEYTGIELFVQQQANAEYLTQPCLYIISKALLDKYEHRFIPNTLHEDNAFTFEVLISAARAGFINKKFYHRRLHSNSIMTKSASIANLEGYLVNYVHMLNFLEGFTFGKSFVEALSERLTITLKAARSAYNKLSVEERQAVASEDIGLRILYNNLVADWQKERELKEKAVANCAKARTDYNTLKEYSDQHIAKLKETIEKLKENNRILKEHGDRARAREAQAKDRNSQYEAEIVVLKQQLEQYRVETKLLKNEALQRECAVELYSKEIEQLKKELEELKIGQNDKANRAVTYIPSVLKNLLKK